MVALRLFLLVVPTLAAAALIPPPGGFRGDTDEESQDRALNAEAAKDTAGCKTAEDCHDFCYNKLKDDPDAQRYGTMLTCIGQGDVSYGLCSCGNGKAIGEILVGIGEATCIAWNTALNAMEQATISLIPYVGPEIKAASELYKVGKKVVKKGASQANCDIDVCPGHKYTVVDPNDAATMNDIIGC